MDWHTWKRRKRARTGGWVILLSALAAVGMAACDRGTTEKVNPSADQGKNSPGETRMNFVVASPAMDEQKPIADQYTASGANISPPLQWPSPPEGSKEFAILVEDRDAADKAPDKTAWVHWIVYKIPATAREIKENVPRDQQRLSDPAGAIQGKNSWGETFYRGPEPPPGSGPHHYIYRVYALDAPLPDQGPVDRATLMKLMEGHILSHGELVAVYERK